MNDSLIKRFEEADGRRRLIEQLRAQAIVAGNADVAAEIANTATLHELARDDVLIRQDHSDNDLFFIISGKLRIVVNGRDIAARGTGEHVGEMAIIDPSTPRTATVLASENTLVAKINEANVVRIADANPYMWRAMGVQLCRRLNERKRFHLAPNETPIVFIGSSSEQLPIANALKAAIPATHAATSLWSKDVFTAGHTTIDDLVAQLQPADYAVLVLGADDKVISRGKEAAAPRDNVIFELGLFMGALSRLRSFLLVPMKAKVKIPTDLLGVTTLRYDDTADPAPAVATATQELLAIIEKNGAK